MRRRGPGRARLVAAALLAAALLAALPSRPAAHEIPASVTILVYVQPDGRRLRLLVRVPLEAMRDIPFPVRGPGYLDLVAVAPLLREAATLWIARSVELFEGNARLGGEAIVTARASLPSDRSFGSYADALAHVAGPPLPAGTELIWRQALLDVLLDYPIGNDRARFSIRPAFAHLGVRTTTVLRFLPPEGGERVFQYGGDPGLVRLDPRWHQAARRFVELGFLHILGGIDHLLFVICLVVPFRRWRPLVAIVTSFTVAHSITLGATALGFAPTALWFPALVETLIAASVVYMAFENIFGARLERRWVVAFGFGLVHGFGFAFALRDSLQFAGAHLASALLAFNVGVELGQILVLLLAVPVLDALFRRGVPERVGTIVLSALVAHTAWHWMTDRATDLSRYRVRWPPVDLALLAGAARGLMLILALAGVAWLLFGAYRRLTQGDGAEPAGGQPDPAA